MSYLACGKQGSDDGEPNASKGARSVRRGDGWLPTLHKVDKSGS